MCEERTPLWGDISSSQFEGSVKDVDWSAQAFDVMVDGTSERGGRLRNEDSYRLSPLVACVSDGIGGARYGDVMSKLVCAALLDEWAHLDGCDLSGEDRMRTALRKTDEFVSRVSECLGGDSGATVVAVARMGSDLLFGSVGDSRAFLLHDGKTCAVFDELGRENLASNRLVSALGYGMVCRSEAGVCVGRVPGSIGDAFVLCTDGVWTNVTESEMADVLRTASSPFSAASSLVSRAVEVGGPDGDNATAVVGMLCTRGDCREEGLMGSILDCTCRGSELR